MGLLDELERPDREKTTVSYPRKITAKETAATSSSNDDSGPDKKITLSLDEMPTLDEMPGQYGAAFKAATSPTADHRAPDDLEIQGFAQNDKAYVRLDESAATDKKAPQNISAVRRLKDMAEVQERPILVTEKTIFVTGKVSPVNIPKWKIVLLFVFLACLVSLFFFLINQGGLSERVEKNRAAMGIFRTAVAVETTIYPGDAKARTAKKKDAIAPDDDAMTTKALAAKEKSERWAGTKATKKIVMPDEVDIGEATIDADCNKSANHGALCRANNKNKSSRMGQFKGGKSIIAIHKASPELDDATIHLKLKKAFSVYQDGIYTKADDIYQKILAAAPDNRDALLGRAAIAVQQKKTETAQRYYLRLLELDPNDKMALAAIINLYGGKDLLQSERMIKSLLLDAGQPPYLHFVLGNIYAAQARWPDAQQAFFDAYQKESDNPNYALNLAISLDHIGQYKTALEYYRVAVQQIYNNQSFDTVTIWLRIQELSERQAAAL